MARASNRCKFFYPSPIACITFLTLTLLNTGISTHAQTSTEILPWNQWRGPDRDGLLKSQAPWPTSLAGDHLGETWRVPMGPSYSGPLVVEDRVFATETVDKQDERVRCLDRVTGKEIWSKSWPGSMKVPFFAGANGSWIRSTPASADGRLFVAGIRDLLVCLDAGTGEEIWRKDFPALMGSPIPQFGCVCSPLVDGEFVYMQAGGALHKLEQATGKSVWQSASDGTGKNSSVFSSPVIQTVAGVRQLVVQGRTELMGIDLESGKLFWSKTVPAFRGMSILTPTFFNDQFLIANYQHPAMMMAVNRSSDSFSVSESWKVKTRGNMTTPVVIDGNAYLLLQNQRFACIDLQSGTEKWVSDKFSKYASLIANGDQILALTSDGELVLFKANPETFEVIDKRKVANNSWAHLAVVGNQVFVRNIDGLIAMEWK